MFSSFLHVVACVHTSFFLQPNNISLCRCPHVVNHSPTEDIWVCYLLATVNNIGTNILAFKSRASFHVPGNSGSSSVILARSLADPVPVPPKGAESPGQHLVHHGVRARAAPRTGTMMLKSGEVLGGDSWRITRRCRAT